jgi:hypothetical protein
MKTLKKTSVLAACILCFWVASAQAEMLNVGGSFTQPMYLLRGTTQLTEGGGSIDPSYLNGKPLAYLYCVDIATVIYVPGSYNNTSVTTNGMVYGSQVNNAGQIAWLLSNYGTAGQGDAAYALQAAIWHLEDPSLTIDPSRSTSSQVDLYNHYLASLGNNTGNVSNFLWLSPGITGSGTKYQALVGATPTPIPAAVWLLGSGLVGLVGLRRKFTK